MSERYRRRSVPLLGMLAGFGLELAGRAAARLAGDQPELHSLAGGIRRDQEAVTAGLALPYHSGAMEGNVNKIKMIKRQMYGRAGFALLRKRVILHPASYTLFRGHFRCTVRRAWDSNPR